MFSQAEYDCITSNLAAIASAVDRAAQDAYDPPDAIYDTYDPANTQPDPSIPVLSTTRRIHPGGRGAPRIDIDRDMLATLLEFRTLTDIGAMFGCHARTIRRRAIEYGLLEPGEPVYVDHTDDNGVVSRIYTSSTGGQSAISDSELDEAMTSILQSFPTFGRRMIRGTLKYRGLHIPRSRIEASYARVHGAPASSFGSRQVQRRIYSVAGPNALWHHDGQHGSQISLTFMPIVLISL